MNANHMGSFPLYKKMLYTEPRGYVAYYSKFPSFYASPQPLIPAEPYIMHRERERERVRAMADLL